MQEATVTETSGSHRNYFLYHKQDHEGCEATCRYVEISPIQLSHMLVVIDESQTSYFVLTNFIQQAVLIF
jgi:diadenosine tetraphosphate (Ap4A) HIT family hydrolase